MVIIRINKQDYKLPTSWAEVTIDQFQRVSLLKSDFKFEEDELSYKIDLAAIMLGVESSFLEDNLFGNEINTIIEQLKFIQDEDKTPIKNSFEIIIAGKQYYFDFKTFSKQKIAQFIDALSLQRDNQTITNLHQLMACMIRPVTGKRHRYNPVRRAFNSKLRNIYSDYKIEDYTAQNRNDRAELFRTHLTMDKALPLLFFCLNFRLEYLKISAGYSETETQTTSQRRKD